MNTNENTLDETLDQEGIEDNTELDTQEQPNETDSEDDVATNEANAAAKVEEDKKLSRFQRQQQRYEQELEKQRQEIEFLRKLATGGTAPVNDSNIIDEPNLDDFDGKPLSEFIRARDQYLEKKLSAQAEHRARATYEQERMHTEMKLKTAAAKAELPDWDDVMAMAQDDPVPPLDDSVSFILESAIGPKVAYYLAKNPDEHEKINKLSSIRRIVELSKIEDKMSNKEPVVAPQRTVTKAPAKLSDAKGNSSVTTLDPAAAARLGYKEWLKADEARQAAKKK